MLFRRVTFYVAIAGIVGSIFLVAKIRKVPPPPPPAAPPTRSPFAFSVAAIGIVESVHENVKIGTVAAGLVRKLYVHVGSTVKAGDPLMLLDDRQAAAKVDAARAQLVSLKVELDTQHVLVADQQDQFDRMERLARDRVASVDEFQRKDFLLKIAKSRVAKQSAEIALAEAQLRQALTELDVLTVRAPRDGTLIQVNIREGEFANTNPTDAHMVLGSSDRLQVRASVDEQNAPLVVANQPAVAYLKGTTENPIPLEFVRIEPYIVPKRSLTGDNSERVDTRVLELIFAFDRPRQPIYVGQQVDVFIQRPVPSLLNAPGESPVQPTHVLQTPAG